MCRLYPHSLSPSEVWNYLSIPIDPISYGAYECFWWYELEWDSSDSQVAEHLDELVKRREPVRSVLAEFDFGHTLLDLLHRGIVTYGDRIEVKRLYDWLGVGLLGPLDDSVDCEDYRMLRIGSWLEEHAELQKAICAEGVERCAKSDGVRIDASEIWDRLYGATAPADFGLWCLEQASAANDERVARYFLELVFRAMIERCGDEGLSLEVLVRQTSTHPVLARVFRKLSTQPRPQHMSGVRTAGGTEIARGGAARAPMRWVDGVRSHEDALRLNRGPPHLLHRMAAAYFGYLPDVQGSDPRSRLAAVFCNDSHLVETALHALRVTIRREDLPSVEEVIRLRAGNWEHCLALPFLAGLAESERTGPDKPLRLDDERVRVALACRYCGEFNDEATWYLRLLVTDVQTVVTVLVQTAGAEIRNGGADIGSLRELAHSGEHAEVARTASVRLLDAFPIRCAAAQVTDLRHLLWAALLRAEQDSLVRMIGRKLSRASMNVRQRACWLMAGVIMSPEAWLSALDKFVAGGARRVRALVEFLDSGGISFVERLEVPALRLLVRSIGGRFGPGLWVSDDEATLVTLEEKAAAVVREMIGRLGGLATEEAGAALDALASDSSLSSWRDELMRERYEQRVVHRDAGYRHPGVEQICRVLEDGEPANAADLTALVTDRLDEIAQGITNDNSNGWRPFWNEDRYGRRATPKHESACRDALRRELKYRLGHGTKVDPQPEGYYADDTRADIRISCGHFHIPVEIKKNGHSKVWSALGDQLIAQYARDPATGGCGVYVVLWFGEIDGNRTPASPCGARPGGPAMLKRQLEQLLAPVDARKISICVIDVTSPGRGVSLNTCG